MIARLAWFVWDLLIELGALASIALFLCVLLLWAELLPSIHFH